MLDLFTNYKMIFTDIRDIIIVKARKVKNLENKSILDLNTDYYWLNKSWIYLKDGS